MTRERFAFVAVISVAAGLSLAAGGVRSWLLWPWAAVLALVLWASWQAPALQRRLPPILWPLWCAAAFTTLQVLPWPEAFVRLVSPDLAAARCTTWSLLGLRCAWLPLASDVSATALDAARLWLTLGCALMVSSRAQGSGRVSGLWAAIAVAGALHLTAAAATHELPQHVGLFVSPNHQAAFYNVAWASALGFAWLSRGWARRVFVGLTVVLFAAALATLSRAGVAASLLGLLVYGALLSRTLSRRSIAVLMAASAVLCVIGYAAAGPVATAFDVVDPFEKLDIYRPAWRVAMNHALGVGRGGFAWAFTLVRPAQRFWLQHDYIENEALQALSDYGPVFGVVALACVAWVIVSVVRQALPASDGRFEPHRPKAVAVAAACVMLLGHNLFDFNWQMPGVFVPVWCSLAALAQPGARAFGSSAMATTRWPMRTWASVAVVLSLPLAGLGWWSEPLRLERQATASRLERLVWGRPTDGAALVALARQQPPRAMLWLNAAMAVDPMYGKTYIDAAALLCRGEHFEQAFATARRALLVEPNLGAATAAVLQGCAAPVTAWVALLAPEFDRKVAFFALLHAPAEAVPLLIDEYLVFASTPDDGVLAEMARRTRATPRWQRVMQVWQTRPTSPERTAEQAEARWAEGDREAALADYRALAIGPNLAIRARWVELLWQAGHFDEADEANVGLLRDCEREPRACRTYHQHRARSALRRGKKHDALFEYRLMLMKDASDVDAAFSAAQVLAEQSDERGALDVIDRADPHHKDARLQTLRGQLQARRDQAEKLFDKVFRP